RIYSRKWSRWRCRKSFPPSLTGRQKALPLLASWDGSGNNLGHDFRERTCQVIDIGLGAEWSRADAHRAIRESPQRTMDVRGAVQARPHGNVEGLIQDAAQFCRRQRLATKA